MDWKIYYEDGTTFSDSDGKPEEAPARGVQIIMQAEPHLGREILRATDFYIRKNEQWFAVDHFGLFDYLSNPGLKTVKFGRYIPNDEYARVLADAVADPDFPPKSAWGKKETR